MSTRHIVVAALAAAALAVASPQAHAQNILLNFSGSNLNNSGFFPPDTQGAVGATGYVELVNGRYADYSKTNGATLTSSSLNGFWQSAGVTLTGNSFDPRVVYDPNAQRFYASALDFGPTDTANNHFNNDILLAVSKTSDPTQGWTGISIPSFPTGSTNNFFADFDTLGYNQDGVTVSVNDFPTTGPDASNPDGNQPPVDPNNTSNATGFGVSFLVTPKTSLSAGSSANSTLIYNQNPNNVGFAAHPATDLDNTTGTQYIFSDYSTSTGANSLSTITGTNASPTLHGGSGNVTVTAYNAPPPAQQPNGDNTLDTGDTRFGSSVVKFNNQIWSVQDITLNGRAALNLVRLNLTTGAVTETTIGDAQHDYYYGSVAVNALGTVVVGYTRSGTDGTTGFASSYASIGAYTASGVTFNTPPLLLKQGVANYDIKDGNGTNRWGDYSATTVDPTDPTKFWTSEEWASGTNIWSTQITELDTSMAPEPSPAATIGMFGLVIAACMTCRRRAPKIDA